MGERSKPRDPKMVSFRGKRLDTKKWVYGFPQFYADGTCIIRKLHLIYTLAYKVDPATVGQWAEVYDRHGTEVYEKDIIVYRCDQREPRIRPVIFKWGTFGIEGDIPGSIIPFVNVLDREMTVIGNTVDNPELLEEQGNGRLYQTGKL